MRYLVLDTSVFVSALMSAEGASREVLRRCLLRQYQPLMGNALYAEYESVLARDEIFKRCVLSADERERLFDALLSVCRWQRVYYLWRPNLRDEADNHLVELALAGGAEYIVTHNLHDFSAGELKFPGLRIAAPSAFLKESVS